MIKHCMISNFFIVVLVIFSVSSSEEFSMQEVNRLRRQQKSPFAGATHIHFPKVAKVTYWFTLLDKST